MISEFTKTQIRELLAGANGPVSADLQKPEHSGETSFCRGDPTKQRQKCLMKSEHIQQANEMAASLRELAAFLENEEAVKLVVDGQNAALERPRASGVAMPPGLHFESRLWCSGWGNDGCRVCPRASFVRGSWWDSQCRQPLFGRKSSCVA